MVSISGLIPSYTMQQVIPNICIKFQHPRCSCSWEIFDTNFPMYWSETWKQVAQRATIAHLSPMCQVNLPRNLMQPFPTPMMLHIKFDQDWPTGFRDIQVRKCEIFVTQGQVTPKWVVWFGPKSNLTEFLCLSWLPATLTMIWSKMNKLAWRHHFPIISLWEIFLMLKGS